MEDSGEGTERYGGQIHLSRFGLRTWEMRLDVHRQLSWEYQQGHENLGTSPKKGGEPSQV